MTKTKKTVIAVFMTLLLVCLACFTLTACGKKNELTGLELDSTNVKVDYIEGEQLNLDGLVVTAVYGEGDKATKETVTGWEANPAAGTALIASNRNVAIKYTEGEKSASANLKINVHNNVTDVTEKSAPTKLRYFEGQPFDLDGMVVTLTYESGKAEDIDMTTVPATEITIEPAAITEATEVTVTYRGKEFKYNAELVNGVYIEAEDGILPIGAVLCTDGLDNDAAHKPSGTGYVGDLAANDDIMPTMTFVFNADKAGKGNVSFRMASQYLKQDNNWTPIWMGDVQLNKIANLYVNDKKVEITNDKILLGGGQPDGTPDGSLWLNWQTVEFTDVDFIAGKNTIDLEFKEHDYDDCSQSGKNNTFTANIDSIIVTSDECIITKFPLSFEKQDVTVTGVSLELGEKTVDGKTVDVPYYVIEGTAYYTGYSEEEAAFFMNNFMNKTVKSNNANQYSFSGIGFDFQGNLASGGNSRYLNSVDAREIVFTQVANDKADAGATDYKATFKIKIDVSSLGLDANKKGMYSTHFDLDGGTSKNFSFITAEETAAAKASHEADETALDVSMFHVDMVSDQTIMTSDYNVYKLVYRPWYTNNDGHPGYYPSNRQQNYYGTVGLEIVNNAAVKDIAATGVKLEQIEEQGEGASKVALTVSGTFGYSMYNDEDVVKALTDALSITLKEGNNVALSSADVLEVAVAGKTAVSEQENEYTATFTATVYVDSLLLTNEYTVAFNGADLTLAANAVDTTAKSLSHATYALETVGEEATVGVKLTVISLAKITSYTATEVKIEAVTETTGEDDNAVEVTKAVLTVKGTIAWTIYDATNAAAAFNQSVKFDLTANETVLFNTPANRKVVIEESAETAKTGTFTMTMDVSNIGGGAYTLHFGEEEVQPEPPVEGDGEEEAQDEEAPVKVPSVIKVVVNTEQVVANHAGFTLAGDADTAVTLTVEKGSLTLSERPTSADLEKGEDGKVYLILNGTYTSKFYTEDEIKTFIANRPANMQGNQNAGHANWNSTVIHSAFELVTLSTTTQGEGEEVTTVNTFSVKFDITSFGKGAWTNHFDPSGSNSGRDYKPETDANTGKSVVAEGKQFTLDVVPGDSGGQHFWGCPGVFITDAPAETTPETPAD